MTSVQGNPYVGPRSFQEHEQDRFFGREREARDLLSIVLSERVVLFYAQSGAGKSSLLNTRLRPGLRREGFLILPTGRVSGDLPPGIENVDNIYLFNLLLKLDQKPLGGAERFAHMTFVDFLSGLNSDDGVSYYYEEPLVSVDNASEESEDYASDETEDYVREDRKRVDNTRVDNKGNTTPPHALIIDQFEELFTHHPSRWREREDFFAQLEEALIADPMLWIILSMREDYLASVDPYGYLISGRLQDRFYMQRLEYDAALLAVKEPAVLAGRPFAEGVAERLVDDLGQVRVQGSDQPFRGQFVESVGLQVTCYELWKSLEGRPLGPIQLDDLQGFGGVDRALTNYYEASIEAVLADEAARDTEDKVTEVDVRRWINDRLITEAGTRGNVFRGASNTSGMPNRIVDGLIAHFLLRGESRSGGSWVELTHDRFIPPIIEANRRHLEDLKAGAGRSEAIKPVEPQQSGLKVEDTIAYESSEGNLPHASPADVQSSISRGTVPVIFLAFANDREAGYLRNLPAEARRLRTALENVQQAGLCELVVAQNVTLDDVFRVFRQVEYRNRIAFFHYSGHANSYPQLIEDIEGYHTMAGSGGFAAFIGRQPGLVLVFLNGCSTQSQVQNLLDAGVSVVIATDQSIDDQVASDFATQFYLSLAAGSSISTAFAEAEAAMKIVSGNNPRDLFSMNSPKEMEERWPWAMYMRPGAEVSAQWNLPTAANDPLFGLPPLPKLDLPMSPYRNLDWYRREDAELFFGRGNAIRDLYTHITAADAPPIVLLYGQSGVGKSSLLAAGLLPRLEQSHTVFYLRRDPEMGLLGTLTSSPSPLSLDAQGLGWRQWEQETGRVLMVILDQVEELYTHPSSAMSDEMRIFLMELRETFGDRELRPIGTLLLSFRKEWLAEIESHLAEARLPRAKIFLERLDRRGIIDVVMGPCRVERLRLHYGLTVEEGLAEMLADDLLVDPSSAVAPTLQILLTRMWSHAKQRDHGHPRFDQELYHQLKREGILLGDFLDQQLDTLASWNIEAVRSGLALDLLAYHTTPLATAQDRTAEEVGNDYHHLSAVLPPLVQQCKDLYLLVDPVQNWPDQPRASRLAHDSLAPLVRQRYESSDLPGQRARRILESRAAEWTETGYGATLDDADLAIVENGMHGMRSWTAAESHLVEASHRMRQQRQRQRQLARVGALIGVLSLILNVVLLLMNVVLRMNK